MALNSPSSLTIAAHVGAVFEMTRVRKKRGEEN